LTIYRNDRSLRGPRESIFSRNPTTRYRAAAAALYAGYTLDSPCGRGCTAPSAAPYYRASSRPPAHPEPALAHPRSAHTLAACAYHTRPPC
jgi:hypothetical protein